MHIALVQDETSRLLRGQEHDLDICAAVAQYQLLHQAAKAYDRHGSSVTFYRDLVDVPDNAYVIRVFDTPDVPNAAGYHDEVGLPYGKVFVQPMLDTESSVLSGAFPLSRTICHEALELWGDPGVNVWADRGDGSETPYEIADAVEDDPLIVTLTGKHAGVYPGTNFVLPAWFDPQATGPFDFLGLLASPFAMTANGYQTLRNVDDGSINQIFGEKMPLWKRSLKRHPALRTGLFRTRGRPKPHVEE